MNKSPARATKAARGATLKLKVRSKPHWTSIFTNPLKPLRPKPRQKRIRPRSRRMTKLMAYYRELVKEFLAENPDCQVHKDGKRCEATQVHHCRGRAGTLLIDARWWAAVCHSGHCFLHDEPALAREDGLLCARGQWNHPPDDQETRRLKEIIRELTK